MSERKARSRDISDGLLRQRRNLMAVSLFSFVFFSGGVVVEEINFLGNKVRVDGPEVFNYLVAALFLYFLWRYYQYYREEGFIKDALLSMRRHMFFKEYDYVTNCIRADIQRFVKVNFSVGMSDPKYFWSSSWSGVPKKEDLRLSLFARCAQVYVYYSDERNERTEEGFIEFHGFMEGLSVAGWSPVKTSTLATDMPSFYLGSFRYGVIRFCWWRMRGLARYIFNESYFTDYQLPFILAFLAVIPMVSAFL